MSTPFIVIESGGGGVGGCSGVTYNKTHAGAVRDIVIESGGGGVGGLSGVTYNKTHAGAVRDIVIESGGGARDGYGMKYNDPHYDAVRNACLSRNKIRSDENIDELAGAFIRKYRHKLRLQLEEDC